MNKLSSSKNLLKEQASKKLLHVIVTYFKLITLENNKAVEFKNTCSAKIASKTDSAKWNFKKSDLL